MNQTMTAKDFPTIPEGTVISSGTLRHRDVLSALIEVVVQNDLLPVDKGIVADALGLFCDLGDAEREGRTDWALHERASELIHDLCSALEDFIPAGCYVGMHEGDGSLLGVWRAED